VRLNKLCVYDGEEWVDALRIFEMQCGGTLRYILHHIEDEDLLVFNSLEEALKAAGKRVALESPRVGTCP
jgi:hypothetical protein